MTAPTAPAGSADVSSAPSLGESIGQMLGDAPDFGESPEPEPTSAAGTTPAEPAAGTESETASEPAAVSDAATTAASDGTTPDTPSESPAEDQDPFADTTPATFTVNGQPVTNEDIRVFKEGGAVIRPEALPNVLQKLSERESLQARNHAQSLEYQTLAKAVEWEDPSGKTYSGPEAALELRIGNASMFAENRLLVSVLTDPNALARCLTTEKGPDGKERVVFSPDAIEDMKREVALQQREISAALRDHYKSVLADAGKPAPAPIDHAQVTGSLVKLISESAKLDASLLTPEDKALLAEQLPFHLKDNLASVAWQNLAKRLMTERAAQKAQAQTLVSTTADATKKGLANMAAAARGVKPTAAKPVAPVAPVKPADDRAASESDIWDVMERAGARALSSQR